MKKRSRFYPRVRVDTAGVPAVGQAGGVLLIETVAVAGLDTALSAALARVAQAAGGPRPGQGRPRPGRVAGAGRGLPGRHRAAAGGARVSMAGWPRTRRCPARSTRWPLTRRRRCGRSTRPGRRPAPGCGRWPVSTPPTTAPTRRRRWSSTSTPPWSRRTRRRSTRRPRSNAGSGSIRCGRSSTTGPAGTGEPLAVLLRAGNAGSNTAADHITVARQALAQLPGHRPGARPAGGC